MTKREITSPEMYAPSGVFSTAIEATGRRMIFVSGLTARDATGAVVGEGDIGAQTEQVLQNLRRTLEAAGATLQDVVKVTVFVRDIGDFDAIHAVRRRHFTPPYPASSMVEVSRLVDDRLLIEIEAIAVPA